MRRAKTAGRHFSGARDMAILGVTRHLQARECDGGVDFNR